ncbi:RNA-directed DNA polymerase from mobile element jockey [Trichonephila clavipes]|nr:RNA-directed DNA polymerase from mobile element jockey [Trichonephila clavipes]
MESVGIWKRLVLSCSEWNLDLPSSVFPQAEKRVGGKRISWPSERPYLTVFVLVLLDQSGGSSSHGGGIGRSWKKELEIYQIRKGYINNMIDLENRTPSATTETKSKLEEELKTLDGNISVLEGKLADFLPCPIALCFHNSKNKAVKRTAEPEEHLTSLDTEDGSLWGTARAFRKKASPISALNGPNGIALSDSNKTDLIAQSLESQFQLNDIHNPQKDQIITSIVDAHINDHTNTTDAIPPALPSEIINYIKKIKVKKSPGRDGITNKMIKNLPLITVFKITNIINNMFKLRNFPNAWKTAVVIPILKPGKNPKLAES